MVQTLCILCKNWSFLFQESSVTIWFKKKAPNIFQKNAQFGAQSKNTPKRCKTLLIWSNLKIHRNKILKYFNYFQKISKFYPECFTILTNLHEFVQEKHQKVTKIGLFKDCPIWSPINWAFLKSKKNQSTWFGAQLALNCPIWSHCKRADAKHCLESLFTGSIEFPCPLLGRLSYNTG